MFDNKKIEKLKNWVDNNFQEIELKIVGIKQENRRLAERIIGIEQENKRLKNKVKVLDNYLLVDDFFTDYPEFKGGKKILKEKAKEFKKLKTNSCNKTININNNGVYFEKEKEIKMYYTTPENYKKYKSLIKSWEKEIEKYKDNKNN